MNIQSAIDELEKEWDLEAGFLGNLRQGIFSTEKLERLLNTLQTIELSDLKQLDRRFVSLTWYIPVFMIWQREDFVKQNKDIFELDLAINKVEGQLEIILGIP